LEVHQHISTEDYVITCRLPKLRLLVSQIRDVKPDRSSNGLVENHVAAAGAKPFGDEIRRGVAQRPGGIPCTLRLLERERIEIDSLNIDFPERFDARFARYDRQ